MIQQSAETKSVQVCDKNTCDKKQTERITIGNKHYTFCCQKGFEKSLKEFTKNLNKCTHT